MGESNSCVIRVALCLLCATIGTISSGERAAAQETPQEELPTPVISAPADPSADAPVMEGTEPLLRGPVHEAFAEPLTLETAEPLVIANEPPAAIEEVPPAEKPDGTDVAWIPGYWSWDEDRTDYIWVSGVWRKIPQGRAWVAGKWEKVGTGFQWIAGRWMPTANLPNAEQVAVEPLPSPPATLEIGPNQDAPSDEHFWIPGCWQYRQQRYVWRPGFWSPCQENWVWVPDHYMPVLGGFVYVPGYWDYGWERRGVLYAPCVIDRTIAYRPGFRYTPTIAVSVTNSFFHLWVRPSYGHYYFGDYYDPRYSNWGFVPWYAYHRSSAWAYDPLFVHYRWQFGRDNIDLRYQLHHQHDYYRNHIQDRPVHSYRYHGQDLASRSVDNHSGYGRQSDRMLGYHSHQGGYAAGFSSRDELRRAMLARQSDQSLGGDRSFNSGRSGRSGSPDGFGSRDRFSSGQSSDAWRRDNLDGDLPRAWQGDGRRGGERQRSRDFADSPGGSPIVNPRGVPNQQFGEDRSRRSGDVSPRNLNGVGATNSPGSRQNLTLDELRQRTSREGRMRSMMEGNANRLGTDSLRGRDRNGSIGANANEAVTGPATGNLPANSPTRGRMERFETLRDARPQGVSQGPAAAAPRRANELPGQLTTPRGRLNADQGRSLSRDLGPQGVNQRSVPQSDFRSEMTRSRGDLGRARSESFRPSMEARGGGERSRPEFGRAASDGGRGNFGGGHGDALRAGRGGDGGGRSNLPTTPRGNLGGGGHGHGRGGRG